MSSSQGHAMRRRSGDSPNAYEGASTGKCAHETSEQAYDKAVTSHSPRVAMGTSAYALTNVSAMPSPNTIPRPKAAGPKGDLAPAPGKARTPVLAETSGARYGISVKVPGQHDASAGATMQSARAIPSISGRDEANFSAALDSAF